MAGLCSIMFCPNSRDFELFWWRFSWSILLTVILHLSVVLCASPAQDAVFGVHGGVGERSTRKRSTACPYPAPCYDWLTVRYCGMGSDPQDDNSTTLVGACSNQTTRESWVRGYRLYHYQFDLLQQEPDFSGEASLGGIVAVSRCTKRSYDRPANWTYAIAAFRAPAINPGMCLHYRGTFWCRFSHKPTISLNPFQTYNLKVFVHDYNESVPNELIWGRNVTFDDIQPGSWHFGTAYFQREANRQFRVTFMAYHNDDCKENIKTITLDRVSIQQAISAKCNATIPTSKTTRKPSTATPMIITIPFWTTLQSAVTSLQTDNSIDNSTLSATTGSSVLTSQATRPLLESSTSPATSISTRTFVTSHSSAATETTPWAHSSTTSSPIGSDPLTIGLATGIPVAAFFLTCAFLYCKRAYMLRRTMRKDIRSLSRRRHTLLPSSQGKEYEHSTAGSVRLTQPDFVTHTRLGKYLQLLEIPLAKLQIDNTVLGKGQHGVIQKGAAHGLYLYGYSPDTRTVAIKRVRDKNDFDQRKQLVQEMKVMIKAGRHLNILNLLGVTFLHNEVLLILEYSRYGSLQKYLKFHRYLYYNHTDYKGDILPFDEAEAERILRQQTLHTSKWNHRSDNSQESDGTILSTRDLITFAFQITRGMKYLSSRSIIHRDLAARNVLVCDDRVVKVGDFGLAKQISQDVLIDSNVALPVRWMPVEAITKKKFSLKTDVWSFGIVLWELFGLGHKPYSSDTHFNFVIISDFIKELTKGRRLEQPFACPDALYQIMQQCWKFLPEERPTFSQLEKLLEKLLGKDLNGDYYMLLDGYHHKFNKATHDLLGDVIDDNDDDRNELTNL